MMILLLLLAMTASAKKVHPFTPIPQSCYFALANPHRADIRDIQAPYTPETVCAYTDNFAQGNVPTEPVGRIYHDQVGGGPDTNGWTWSGDGHNLTVRAPPGGTVGAHAVYIKQGAGGYMFYFEQGMFQTHSLTTPNEIDFEHITFCQDVNAFPPCTSPCNPPYQLTRPFGCQSLFCSPVQCCGFGPFPTCTTPQSTCSTTGASFKLQAFDKKATNPNDDVFVGVGDLSVPANRAVGAKKWIEGSCYAFEFKFNATTDKLSAWVSGQGVGHGGIRGHCNDKKRSLLEQKRGGGGAGQATYVEYPNFTAELASKSSCTVDGVNGLIGGNLRLTNGDTNTEVNVLDLALDYGNSGVFYSITPGDFLNSGGVQSVTLPSQEYSAGFTLRGIIDIEGSFSTVPDLSKLELEICCV